MPKTKWTKPEYKGLDNNSVNTAESAFTLNKEELQQRPSVIIDNPILKILYKMSTLSTCH